MAVLLGAASVHADLPYRLHRYDGFKVHEVNGQSIVFFGNSITNMHEWWEAFGNGRILNRGVSGSETPIMLQNLESVLAGHPAKLFLMMGTNDLGTQGMNTPAHVAKNVRLAVTRCLKESPETQVYVQSILPCTTNANGIKRVEDVPVTNDSLRNICQQLGVTYVDLYDDLKGIADYSMSKDGTHLTMRAYRIWCKKIEGLVGSKCVYPDNATDNDGGLSGVSGMRNTYFAGLPIADGDIVMLGDDGNDWHELLHSDRVKHRGNSLGPTSTSIADMQKMVPNIFKGRSDNGQPAAVCIAMGYPEMAGSTALATVEASYRTLVNLVRKNCPDAVIKLMAVYPSSNATTNTSRTVPFNALLKTMAEEMDNVDYVDGTYTLMQKDGVANTDYFTGQYPYGRGYARLSQIVADALGDGYGLTPTTDEEATQRITTINARAVLANAITTAASLPVGDGVGQYTEANLQPVTAGIDDCYTLLRENAADDKLSEAGTTLAGKMNDLLPKINLPEASDATTEHWYQICSSLRDNRYATSAGNGQKLAGGDYSRYAATMWKFVKRADGSYDIVNRADGTYINPVANYNTAVTTVAARPAKGWTLSYGSTPGTFIISCGTVQLNQTVTGLGSLIYNWSTNQTGTDRTDAGCQFSITDAPELEEAPKPIDVAEHEVTLSTGTYNSTGTFNKVWTSQSTDPLIKVSCPNNNMGIGSANEMVFYSGSSTTTTYTISVDDDHLLVGYRFNAVNTAANTNGNTITAGGKTYTTTAAGTQVTVDGLAAQSDTYSQTGDNKGVTMTDFFVKVGRKAPTGIADVTEVRVARAGTYDLKGRRAHKGQKGVLIVDGRKQLVK